MGFQELVDLSVDFQATDQRELLMLAGRYERQTELEILEVAAIAADVSADSILNLGLEPESSPLVMRAFELQYPNVDPTTLVGSTAERLEGLANGIKGKYFEVLVAERMNNGERLGELMLEPGQIARIADSPTQEGWDIEILNSDGSAAELIQLKATTSMSYIKSALVENPGIRIAVPSEVDGVADAILRTDISEHELTQAVQRQIGELSESAFVDIVHQGAEFAFDSVPLVPAFMVALVEGRNVLLGRSSVHESVVRGSKRLGKAGTLTALGAMLTAVDAGIISVPTTVAANVAWQRLANRLAMADFLGTKTEELTLATT